MTTLEKLSERQLLALDIYRSCFLEGEFILRSGRRATHYFDKYQFEADPVLLGRVAAHLCELIPGDTEVLAGLELGGVPLVTELSRLTGLPASFVRKKRKEHGTARLAEGADVAQRTITIVEDVVTSGGQINLSTTDLRELGASVTTAVCVIDREDGGPKNLRENGISLRSLYKSSELTKMGTMESE